jgi:predicted ribosomally synthesized peptide with SipW-like signal peptide
LAASSLEVHATEADALVIVVNGAHVMAADPLAVQEVTLGTDVDDAHVMADQPLATTTSEAGFQIDDALVWEPVADASPMVEAEAAAARMEPASDSAVSASDPGHAKPRRRRWRLVPVAGAAAAALAAGLGVGGAYAYFTATASGSGHAKVGSPVSVTVSATTGAADLLPGGTGAAYFTLHNTNPFAANFNVVAAGAAVVSNNTGLCATSNVSIAPVLPHAFSPLVTVSAGGTSGTESIPGLVKLAANAPSSCQGVTFKVTLTLTGRST